MIVIGILGIILAIAGPTWIRQRQLSQVRVCQENLVQITGAKEQWALENNVRDTAVPDWDDLVSGDRDGYLQRRPFCPASGVYTIGAVNEPVECSITDPDHNALPGFGSD